MMNRWCWPVRVEHADSGRGRVLTSEDERMTVLSDEVGYKELVTGGARGTVAQPGRPLSRRSARPVRAGSLA